jgi:hypothetical protein
MRSSALAVLLAALGAAPAPAQAPAPSPPAEPGAPALELLERVVAVVDERPLFLSDVRALGAVRGLGEAEALEAAVDERLMYAEAARIAETEVSKEEEDRALAALLEPRPALRDEVPEADLRRLLRRQATILKYVEFRFRPQVRVSDDDIRRAWEQDEAGRPAGVPLEDAQEALRARLERRGLDERIEAWVKDLRARADVRTVAPPPVAGEGGRPTGTRAGPGA